jgi:hypothetical protein
MPAGIGGFFLHPEKGDGETKHLGKREKEGCERITNPLGRS